MTAELSISNESSPWQAWPTGEEGFHYSTTSAGMPVAFSSMQPGWIVVAMFTTLATTATITPAMTLKSLIGTGGGVDKLISEDRTDATAGASWGEFIEQIGEQTNAAAADLPEGADLIAEIKATLGVSITDLAGITRVSRQAIYDWLGGSPVSDANYDRLQELRQVCLQWRLRSTRPLGRLMGLKSMEGKTLLNLLEQEPLDHARIGLHLDTLASKAAAQDEGRRARKSKLAPLREQDRYENTLTHAIPATHS